MKKLLFAGIVTASSLSVFAIASPAEAACIPDDATCTTFLVGDTATPAYDAFTGGFSSTGGTITSTLNFNISSFSGSSYTLTGLQLTGLTSSGGGGPYTFVFPNQTISGPGSLNLNSTPIAVNAGNLDFSNTVLSFTIPNTVSAGNTINIGLAAAGGGGSFTAGQTFTTSSFAQPAPGPLPVLGAGAMFGFSRKLRRRIAKAD
ncbi:hypothetical protein [Synechococcus sp. CBW1004]|uniref:hypothetical protein n=1 Tax=Synechococcus sp. CBW1004 TaxID=1353136 RepID=UPI0018CC8C09|nr:hypothetical protein [Synechococcus sp. CBW1004]QPN62778.1 hypothetical protein H8F25_14125 [Synechococcus sp. CBW1004]